MEIISLYIKEMKENGKTLLSGDKAFMLHDTKGFPIDITKEILADEGFKVDEENFDELMAKQKQAGKEDASESDFGWEQDPLAALDVNPTVFTGYESLEEEGQVLALFENKNKVEKATKGQTVTVVMDKTPFYATSGGQLHDIGTFETSNMKARVADVTKHVNIFAHTVVVEAGEISIGDKVNLKVDALNRNALSRNHTATHLLHAALRKVLGTHVQQAGSLVTGDILRFDFSHYEGMKKEELLEVEALVNSEILSFRPVETGVMGIGDVKSQGAIGLFDEKYADEVRVVSIGDFSRELCGDIHVKNSGQIGAIKILSESGIANGVRRIEAVSGYGIVTQFDKCKLLVDDMCNLVKSIPEQLNKKVSTILAESKEMNKKLSEIMGANLVDISKDILEAAREINGVKLITKKFDNLSIDELRKISDEIKAKSNNIAMVFATVKDSKVTFLMSLTDDIVQRGYHAGKMIKEIAATAGGGGGGKADMAQAGGKDASKIDDALAVAEKLL